MPKLTDTQLVILSAAARRAGSAVLPLPKSLKINKGAATSALKSLIKRGLIVEQPAGPSDEAWREAEHGGRMTLAISDAGLRALGVEPAPGTDKGPAATKAPADAPRQGGAGKGAESKSKTEPVPSGTRRGTKQSLLVDLLSRKSGATIAEIVEATGWQPHSVRGAISGTLKKKLGYAVAAEAVEGRGRVYRIVAGG